MSDTINSFLNGYITCVLAMSWGYAAQLFYLEVKKFLSITKFLTTGKTCKTLNEVYNYKNKLTHQFVMLEGTAHKIFPRSGDYINSDIILSKAYSTYYEDFFLRLKGGNVLIQPFQKTQLCYLKQEYLGNSGIFMSFIRNFFFNKSEVLKSNDKIYIFGEINKDTTYVPIDDFFSVLVNIKPKVICAGTFDDFSYSIKSLHLSKSFFYLIGFAICSFGFIYQFRKNVWPGIKKLKTIIKKRLSSNCKVCKINPCNVLCESCENLTDLCDQCYRNFQVKLNNNEIMLKDIKCVNCKVVMKSAQLLLLE